MCSGVEMCLLNKLKQSRADTLRKNVTQFTNDNYIHICAMYTIAEQEGIDIDFYSFCEWCYLNTSGKGKKKKLVEEYGRPGQMGSQASY